MSANTDRVQEDDESTLLPQERKIDMTNPTAAKKLVEGGASFEDVCALLWSAPFRPEDDLDALRLGAPVAQLRALLKALAVCQVLSS